MTFLLSIVEGHFGSLLQFQIKMKWIRKFIHLQNCWVKGGKQCVFQPTLSKSVQTSYQARSNDTTPNNILLLPLTNVSPYLWLTFCSHWGFAPEVRTGHAVTQWVPVAQTLDWRHAHSNWHLAVAPPPLSLQPSWPLPFYHAVKSWVCHLEGEDAPQLCAVATVADVEHVHSSITQQHTQARLATSTTQVHAHTMQWQIKTGVILHV